MTETDISESEVTFTQIDALILQIEAMLHNVARKNIVDAASMQDGLLDLMQSVRAMKAGGE